MRAGAHIGLGLLATLAGCADVAVELDAPDAGPPPAPSVGHDAQACGACHAEHLVEWRASRHATAFTGSLFQREWEVERDPLCLVCHAPRVREDSFVEPARAAAGVDCASCHVVDGVVRATAVSGQAPHPSRPDPGLATSAACARCHQVDFPRQPGLPMQDTAHEWRAAGEPAGACQTCHAPRVGERHRHDFIGGHDPAWISRALRIEPERSRVGSHTRVTFTLHNDGAGHAIPTGDVFRRLAVRAWPRGVPNAADERELGRHFRIADGDWRPRDDDRVPARGTRRVELELPGHPSHIEWALELRSLPAELVVEPLPPAHAPRVVRRGTL